MQLKPYPVIPAKNLNTAGTHHVTRNHIFYYWPVDPKGIIIPFTNFQSFKGKLGQTLHQNSLLQLQYERAVHAYRPKC